MEREKRLSAIAYGVLTLLCGAASLLYAVIDGGENLLYAIVISFSFITLGMLIKYGDQAYDSDRFSKNVSNMLAVPCGIWMGALILLDQDVATIFTGMLIALLIASKYDNVAFKVGFVVAFIASVVNLVKDPGDVNYLGIVIIFIAAFVDEIVSDLADVRGGRSVFWAVMGERPVLKLVVLALCTTSLLSSYLYFFAFLGFDFGYSFIARMADQWGCGPAQT